MIVLALDTTTRAGSLALTRDGELVDLFVGDAARTHATRLPGDLVDCLGRRGLSLADVDLFAVAAGPGSFTGLRIGIATMQGLAFANRRPLTAVSALDALAYSTLIDAASPAGGAAPPLIGAWMDAQRHEVYAALYRQVVGAPGATGADPAPGATGADPVQGSRGRLEVVLPAVVGDPAVVASEWDGHLRAAAAAVPPILAGDGALTYRSLVEERWPGIRVIDPVPALAPAIADIARQRAQLGLASAPHAVKPVYVRRPDAELARDRRAEAEQPPVAPAAGDAHE